MEACILKIIVEIEPDLVFVLEDLRELFELRRLKSVIVVEMMPKSEYQQCVKNALEDA